MAILVMTSSKIPILPKLVIKPVQSSEIQCFLKLWGINDLLRRLLRLKTLKFTSLKGVFENTFLGDLFLFANIETTMHRFSTSTITARFVL